MDIKSLFLTAKGRIPRSQYWLGLLCVLVVGIISTFVFGGDVQMEASYGVNGQGGMASSSYETPVNAPILTLLINIGLLVITYFLYIKRFHDLDKSGWFSLLMLVPFVNLFVGFIWLGCIKGTDGANQYGPDPLGGADEAVTIEAE